MSIFHISVRFYWYVPSNFPDSNPMNLFAYGIYTTSRFGFGVPTDWRALEGLKLSQKRLVSLSLSISLSLSLRVRNFQNRPLGEVCNRKESGPSARRFYSFRGDGNITKNYFQVQCHILYRASVLVVVESLPKFRQQLLERDMCKGSIDDCPGRLLG